MNVIINPAIMFFLYLYPFDLRTKPKTIDASGMGVIEKNTHIFSVKSPFASDIAPTKTIAPKTDSIDAANSKFDMTLHLFGMELSTVLAGLLYIYE